MKHLITHLFFFIVLFGHSQIFSTSSTITSHAHNNFNNGTKLTVLTSEENNSSMITVLHTDENENILHQQDVLLNVLFPNIIGLVIFDDGSYLFAIEAYDNSDMNNTFSVLKFSNNHDLIWSKKINSQNFYSTYFRHSIIDNGNGGAFISYSAYDCLAVINLDSNGSVLWSKRYIGLNSYGKSPGFSICKNGMGGVIGTIKDGTYQCVVNIDSNGQPIWSKTYLDKNYRWPVSINRLNEGNFLIAGEFYDNNYGEDHLYIQKISSTGDLIFAKKIINESIQCHDITINNNNEIYILGSSNYDYQTVILKLSANCNIQSSKKIDKLDLINNYHSYYRHSFTSDTSTSFTAKTSYDNKPTLINLNDDISSMCYSTNVEGLLVTDDVAMQQATITSGVIVDNLLVNITDQSLINVPIQRSIEMNDACTVLSLSSVYEDQDFSIFPNPASSHLTINLSANNDQSLTITDMHGKKVYEICQSCSGQIETNVSTLESGVYYVVLSSPESQQVKKLLIN